MFNYSLLEVAYVPVLAPREGAFPCLLSNNLERAVSLSLIFFNYRKMWQKLNKTYSTSFVMICCYCAIKSCC